MKKITVITFGLLLAATPAFAGGYGNGGDQGYGQGQGTQISGTAVLQDNTQNDTGNAFYTYGSDSAGNGGVSGVNANNSAGIINQNVNTGATSNVGSATNVAITGGFSVLGGNINGGNPNDSSTQIATATLEQVNAYNATGNSLCYGTSDSTYNSGVSNIGISGSTGVISQQVNAGVTSNVGSATGIAIH